jgi:hypothetical protein
MTRENSIGTNARNYLWIAQSLRRKEYFFNRDQIEILLSIGASEDSVEIGAISLDTGIEHSQIIKELEFLRKKDQVRALGGDFLNVIKESYLKYFKKSNYEYSRIKFLVTLTSCGRSTYELIANNIPDVKDRFSLTR